MEQVTRPVLVLELTDRSKSDYILEGSVGDGNPIYLDAPAWRRIPPISVILTPEGTYRRIRHIQGAPSIFVDEQDKAGFKFNPIRDNIIFNGAIMTVVREGRDVSKYDYLKACEYNQHAERSPGNGNILFKEVRHEEVATSDVMGLKFQERAKQIIGTLYTEVGDGTIKYHMDEMTPIARAVGVNPDQPGALVLMAIAVFADRHPKRFIETIADKTVQYRQDIKEAHHLGVLTMLDAGAALRSTPGSTFLKFKKKTLTDRIEELVAHYLSAEGEMDYKNLRVDLEAQRAALREVA